MKSFIEYPNDHPFSIHNLPYGSFYTNQDASSRRCGVAIGGCILDLQALSYTTFYPGVLPRDTFAGPTLNAFMSLDKDIWLVFRVQLQELLSKGSPINLETTIRASNAAPNVNAESHIVRPLFVDRLSEDTAMCLPCDIGDYSDFYSSLEHTYNCGVLIRGKEKAMQLNWRHLPVAYHSRASSIVPSGTPIHRPVGQKLKNKDDTQPVIEPCARLDFELEVGFFYGGQATKLGERLSLAQATDRVFGAFLLNDWSARDIQTWEYVPLGPFLSKNFASTISPWIVPIHALETFTFPGYDHNPPLLPYLEDANNTNFDIPLTVSIKPAGSASDPKEGFTTISHSSLRHTYYTIRQMIAHHSTTGCPLKPGDLLRTGTLSAPGTEGYGSLLEKCEMGKRPFKVRISRGEEVERTFIQDGDTVKFEGTVKSSDEDWSIGFGQCVGTILAAIPL
ncbi:related to fumarylacetoacetate hydrolase [Ustilago bromivora]|uniref:Fumarylacetoacetase n=1 Tax=Ustilago bromivora TaxID=307758 RepID=A0A1K0H3U9_9BASI|nr:related to fumarylacetoacetate hydrolase [Ustilago bromivora]